MLNSSARSRKALGIHPVDSVDMQHPSSLANQVRHRDKFKPWDNRSLAIINHIKEHNRKDVAVWDSTIRRTSVGLWRPPERHRAVAPTLPSLVEISANNFPKIYAEKLRFDKLR